MTIAKILEKAFNVALHQKEYPLETLAQHTEHDIKELLGYYSKEDLTFGQAIEAAKQGKKVARQGWNGKGMWITVGEGVPSLNAEQFWNQHTRKFAEENGGSAEVLPYILFKTADNKILMGWLASQTDILANDWIILD